MIKKVLACIIAALLVVTAMTGCSRSAPAGGGTVRNGIGINILSMSGGEYDSNVNLLRDMLTKAGFNVTVNIQPDYASFITQLEGGNYDVAISGWTTVTGNPDYAVRSLFKSDGDYNRNGLNDPVIDSLIELAASQTPAEYVKTYTEFEHWLVTENAYIFPLYANIRTLAVNTAVLKSESVRLSRARSQVWEMNDYHDRSLRETRPLMMSQGTGNLTSLDPIKANDGSINQLSSNMNVRLVNLTDYDDVVPEGSLSWQYVIADGNADFYFILRDDVNFARVENRAAVNTGVRVGAEDVVFSLNRARDRNSVPDHRTYSLHESMSNIVIVTDAATLDTVRDSDSGRTLREMMERNTPTPIRSLTANKTQANNAAGVYQLVRITTHIPFPQVLNYLAHQSAGIVSQQQITAINNYPVSAYDRTVHIAYGDQATITEGRTYNNHLWTSGPYIPLYKNDYLMVFERNPGYMPGTDNAPKIKNIEMKFISDKDAEISAFRSRETDLLFTVPTDKFDLITTVPDFNLMIIPSHAASYLLPNFAGVLGNVNLRLALLYSINQEDILAFYGNRYFPSYSTLSSLIDTGNVLVADDARVRQYLTRYWESIGE